MQRLRPVFVADRPDDSRLNDAVHGAQEFAAGRLGIGSMRKLAEELDWQRTQLPPRFREYVYGESF